MKNTSKSRCIKGDELLTQKELETWQEVLEIELPKSGTPEFERLSEEFKKRWGQTPNDL